MAAPVVRLIALQNGRRTEIQGMIDRLRARERSSFNANIVHARIDTLRQIMEEARATHSEIVISMDPEVDNYLEGGAFTRLLNLYEDTSDFLMTVLTEIETAHEVTLRAADSRESLVSRTPLSLKLPRLKLPKFSGNYSDWESFRDIFKPLVHDIPDYPDSAKLTYLKQCMTDKAVNILKGVTPTKASYESVWGALNKRF